MSREEVLSQIRDTLGDRLLRFEDKSADRVFIDVSPDDVPETSRLLLKDLQARFQIATGIDMPTAIEVLYHWALDRMGCVVTVRTRVDRQQPEIESIASLCPAAEWIEREIWELLGVRFRNHPDLRHLLLSDDWPAGKYPLRRDYQK